ncbi:hypothetical protein THER_0483 [Thermodesulfovibrio sp. N1]|nr:hypothetical protein THER_0483 [Thermodesulfovibrio sp. N1]
MFFEKLFFIFFEETLRLTPQGDRKEGKRVTEEKKGDKGRSHSERQRRIPLFFLRDSSGD